MSKFTILSSVAQVLSPHGLKVKHDQHEAHVRIDTNRKRVHLHYKGPQGNVDLSGGAKEPEPDPTPASTPPPPASSAYGYGPSSNS